MAVLAPVAMETSHAVICTSRRKLEFVPRQLRARRLWAGLGFWGRVYGLGYVTCDALVGLSRWCGLELSSPVWIRAGDEGTGKGWRAEQDESTHVSVLDAVGDEVEAGDGAHAAHDIRQSLHATVVLPVGCEVVARQVDQVQPLLTVRIQLRRKALRNNPNRVARPVCRTVV